MPDMIEVLGIAKSFGPVKALAGIDFSVPEGTVYGLLGPNGAGKTTAVRVLTTLLKPDSGKASVAGYDVVAEPRQLRASIGLAGQFAAVDEILTGRENLEMVGRLYHLSRAEARNRATALLDQFELTDAADKLVRSYSGGMRRRLDLGASLVGNPPVLFLDEPTTGLDPRSRRRLWEFIERLVGEGTTLLLTTQYLEEADRLADRVGVIDNGTLIAEGTADELKGRMGGDVIELLVEDAGQLAAAATALRRAGMGDPIIDEPSSSIRVTVDSAVGAITVVVREMDNAAITLSDISIHRPSLDDVFLALTGPQGGPEPSIGREPAATDGGGPNR